MARHRLAPLLAWLCLAVIWGSSFVFMKMATLHITPLQVAFVRAVTGIIPIAILALVTRQLRFGHIRYVPHYLVMACLAAVFFYYGLARGTSLLHSGVAGALSGMIPLFSFLAAMILLPNERSSLPAVLGLVISFGGVLLIARPYAVGVDAVSREGVVVMTLACMSLGLSFVYARRFVTPLGIPPVALTTYQLGFAVLLLAVITPFNGISDVTSDTAAYLGLVLGLGLVGTGGAYFLFYYIIDQLGAVGASSVTFFSPAIALLVGLVFVDEPISGIDIAGTAFIIVGVLLIAILSERAVPKVRG